MVVQYDLSKIMKRAHEIKKEDQSNVWSLCLKMAWDEFKSNNSIKNSKYNFKLNMRIRDYNLRYTIEKYKCYNIIAENFKMICQKFDLGSNDFEINGIHFVCTELEDDYQDILIEWYVEGFDDDIICQNLINKYKGKKWNKFAKRRVYFEVLGEFKIPEVCYYDLDTETFMCTATIDNTIALENYNKILNECRKLKKLKGSVK